MIGLSSEAVHRQGGDLRGLDRDTCLDLSTCVNLYGPPPAVREVLHDLDVRRLRPHPYEAESSFRAGYAEHLAVDPSLLVPGRGITEFIHILTRLLPRDRIAVVTPDYTDSIRRVVNHLPPIPGEIDTVGSRLDRIATGMARYDYVLVSNPNNPLGLHVPVAELAEVCRMNPRSTLVVDEAYVDFLEGGQRSMASTDLSNVVVLTSPNKVLGMAGVRMGALWTRDARLRQVIADERLNWPLSFLDSAVVIAALRDSAWVEWTRARLLDGARVLEALLDRRFGGVVKGTPVHYRFVASEDPVRDHAELVRSGVVVRVFDGDQAGRVPGLRVTTPTDEDLPKLIDALAMRAGGA
ncbi:hypothetical protein SD37_10295 [Amycolatopsis orientalis]|uniref:Aminotransferase class I/classII large domain-containing protein n=1 Tax=Amycolatopsis orientalis TaxID=31958 RepID=A0A193BUU4_AMYOR|nr:aminotransferase class I/II-fold pyridoxal phosphate-dependent enzyme [Amycolatopsis orientalis]ANN15991.1 hypothetical protein SD37_10295 [Amycolatopsis orientalis]